MDRIVLQTEVDVKCFGERVTIEKNMGSTNSEKRYIYKISRGAQSYILKGFKIHLEHLSLGNKKVQTYLEKV